MSLVIDTMQDSTLWTGTADQISNNEISDYIANNYSVSTLVNFTATDQYVQRIFDSAIDVSNYTELIFHVVNLTYGKVNYESVDYFDFKIEIGTGNEFYMKAFPSLAHQTISIEEISSIDMIKITSLSDNDNVLIISSLMAVNNDYPYDMFSSMKSLIENVRDEQNEKIITTLTVDSGIASVEFGSTINYLNELTIIKISDDTNSEIHQIKSIVDMVIEFNNNFDGNSIINSYTDANVSLYYPVEFQQIEMERNISGISIWGISPNFYDIETDIGVIYDSWAIDGSLKKQSTGHYVEYIVQIDVESRSYEILNELSKIVSIAIGRNKLWINNFRCYIDFSSPATEQIISEPSNIIPKISFFCSVKFKYDIYNRENIGIIEDINLTTEVG